MFLKQYKNIVFRVGGTTSTAWGRGQKYRKMVHVTGVNWCSHEGVKNTQNLVHIVCE